MVSANVVYRPKLSDPAHEGVGLQPRCDGRDCCTWACFSFRGNFYRNHDRLRFKKQDAKIIPRIRSNQLLASKFAFFPLILNYRRTRKPASRFINADPFE